MKYTQRDIVEINFLFPNGNFKPHPAIIVSNDELQESEGIIYFVLVSSKDYNPQYNYKLTETMLTCNLSKQSYVKCQIIVGNVERDVIKKLGKMKQPYFDEMLDKIIASIF